MGRLLQALGLQVTEQTPEEIAAAFAPDVLPPSRPNGLDLPLGRALSLPAVYRAVAIIAGMGAQLTLDAIRNDQVVENPFVRQPDPWRSLSSFLERALVGMALDGNAYLRKYRTGSTVVAAEVLDPRLTTPRWLKRSGRWVKVYDTWTRDGYVTLEADDVEHVWGLEVPGYDRGLGPIAACRVALGGILDVREYAANWFQDPDQVTGVLTSDQRLDPATARHYKDLWIDPDKDLTAEERSTRRRLGPSVRVMGQGLKFEPFALNPEDAQWLQAQGAGVLDVARMFGLPGDYLLAAVEGTSLTYANLEMIDAQFLRTTLFPGYLRKLEAAVTNMLPRGQSARFDTSALLRPDAKTRAEIDAIYLPLGVDTNANVAAREGRPTGTVKPAPAPAPANQ